ncbi:MAG TPA: hypothetical protein VLK82_09645 [Candidatus Tectomicrobia bacterium]|nr:hypothetical protein [Candidatus Tectomicrobia bacterium]
MRAHSQTIDRRPQVGVTVNVGGLDWFHRLRQWFGARTQRQRKIGPVSPYGTWDAQRERFQPMRAEAAADIIAARTSLSCSTRIYAAEI